jgi:hypothetical protein
MPKEVQWDSFYKEDYKLGRPKKTIEEEEEEKGEELL